MIPLHAEVACVDLLNGPAIWSTPPPPISLRIRLPVPVADAAWDPVEVVEEITVGCEPRYGVRTGQRPRVQQGA